jgi:hypothetical protein
MNLRTEQNSLLASCYVTNGPSRPAFDVPLCIFCFFHPSVFSTYTECYVGWSCTTRAHGDGRRKKKMVRRFSFRPRLRPCPAESPAFYDPYTVSPCLLPSSPAPRNNFVLRTPRHIYLHSCDWTTLCHRLAYSLSTRHTTSKWIHASWHLRNLEEARKWLSFSNYTCA